MIKNGKILKNYYIFLRDFLFELFDEKIGHYASSLSWSSLFSIIPLLVILLWIITKMSIFDSVYLDIKELIFSNLLPTNSKELIGYINQFMENSYKLGFVGFIYTMFASIMFFRNYDYIINDIFDTKQRGFKAWIKLYPLLVLITPIMIGLSFYLSSIIQGYLDKYTLTSAIHILYILPYLIIWMLFFILFKFTPNRQIDKEPALISSFISSIVWYISKSGFLFYILHNKTYTTIYGSVSTFLFFFLWIYISWAIFLHGLKFCDLLNKDEEITKI